MSKIKKMGYFLFRVFLVSLSLATLALVFFNFPVFEENSNAKLGVTFSNRYASDIGLDWKETYLAIMDDFGIKKIRIPVYWDSVEKEEDVYDFSEIDWQLEEAGKRNAEIVLVLGQKVPRWPECYVPEYLKNNDEKRREELLEFIEIAIEKYKNNKVIKYWQIENEPFLKFGVCPEFDKNLLDKEIALVKENDSSRKIIITDSGELSIWLRAAKRGDIFGTTMYRTIYNAKYNLFYEYPIGPRFFQFKNLMNKIVVGQENAIVIELQAEPWIAGWTTSQSLEKQFESMNAQKLQENVQFAKEVGFPEIYLWGAEWWYWLKTKHNHPELWETARAIFKGNT
jgi:ubiquitin-protein ligase